MSNSWDGGTRENALEALRIVLGGIEGVKTVRREPPSMDLVISDLETPAILIDDSEATFSWVERHGRRIQRTASSVLLDCHAHAQQIAGRHQHIDAPTLRNAFARRIMLELADNPRLEVQLQDVDDEIVAHCKDCAHSFQLRTLPVQPPWIRFGLIISLMVDDCLDQRARTDWQQFIMTIQPEQPGIVLPSEKEIDCFAQDLVSYFTLEQQDNLLGLWTFDDGGHAFDLSDNRYRLDFYGAGGDALNAPVRKEDALVGEFNKSTRFANGVAWRRLVDGAQASFDVDRDAYELANIARDQSFSVVVIESRDRDLGADQALAGWAGPSGAYFQLLTNDAGETVFRLLGNDAGNTLQELSGGSSSVGDLVMRIGVVDRENDEARVYQNGTEVDTLADVTTEVGGLEAHEDSIFGVGAYAVGPVTSTAVETPTAVQTPYSGRVQLVAVVSTALDDAAATRLRDLAGLA